ncbi:hypothetical protein BDZ45DRAFT_734493 [Acephala macrosclerotiorum]|nr:hypothetical protein BDZ45DRAFT_734493 [Acephala macrosclerotiorum]
MSWKTWASLPETVRTNVYVLHILYHSARLSLNCPFLVLERTKVSEETARMLKPSLEICECSTDSMTSSSVSIVRMVSRMRQLSLSLALSRLKYCYYHGK